MKQINMLESPVRQVFFSYLVPSISATLVTSIYILADTMMIGRGVGGSGIPEDAAMKNAPEVILRRHSVWCLLCQQSF